MDLLVGSVKADPVNQVWTGCHAVQVAVFGLNQVTRSHALVLPGVKVIQSFSLPGWRHPPNRGPVRAVEVPIGRKYQAPIAAPTGLLVEPKDDGELTRWGYPKDSSTASRARPGCSAIQIAIATDDETRYWRL